MYEHKGLFEGRRFAWYGQRALDCVGLDRFLDLDLIMCCDFGLDTPFIMQERDHKVMSIEAVHFLRENWTSNQLDRILTENSYGINTYLEHISSPLTIIAYSATKSLAKLVQLYKAKVQAIMPDYELKLWLDDKIQFAKSLRKLNIPSLFSSSRSLGDIDFDQVKLEVGLPFVLHLPLGSASSGTFFIRNPSDLERVFSAVGNSNVLISKYIDGISLNINAAVLGDQVVTSFPSVQLVGLEGCSTRPEVYCGNDFSAAQELPEQIVSTTRKYTTQIGAWLSGLGYRGIFGLDFVVDMDKGAVFPVDLNPRFQNSTHLLTQCEIIQGQMPLSVLAIAWQLGLLGEDEIRSWVLSSLSQPRGAQVIVHNLAESVVKVTGELVPGIYPDQANGAAKLRDGISLLDSLAEREIVISCGVPRLGTDVVPEAPLFKIFTRKSVFDTRTRQLVPQIRQICTSAYDELMLQTAAM